MSSVGGGHIWDPTSSHSFSALWGLCSAGGGLDEDSDAELLMSEAQVRPAD
jgi:hypothetical protein